jgi:hypothetical protein
MKSRSVRSLSVNAGKVIFVSGKLMPFLDERAPPSVTTTFTSLFFSMLKTLTSNFPSSIKMVFPIFTSL